MRSAQSSPGPGKVIHFRAVDGRRGELDRHVRDPAGSAAAARGAGDSRSAGGGRDVARIRKHGQVHDSDFIVTRKNAFGCRVF